VHGRRGDAAIVQSNGGAPAIVPSTPKPTLQKFYPGSRVAAAVRQGQYVVLSTLDSYRGSGYGKCKFSPVGDFQFAGVTKNLEEQRVT
jgi:hypothetical protein